MKKKTGKCYVKLNEKGEVCLKTDTPTDDSWIEAKDWNVQLGDQLDGDKGADLSKRKISEAELWSWAQLFHIDGGAGDTTVRWADCLVINAPNQMTETDWADLRAFWKANK